MEGWGKWGGGDIGGKMGDEDTQANKIRAISTYSP